MGVDTASRAATPGAVLGETLHGVVGDFVAGAERSPSWQVQWPTAPARTLIIPRPAEFEAKLTKFRDAGLSDLQVIMDFDHTLTRFRLPDGRRCPMCHDVVKHSSEMPAAFALEYDEVRAALSRKLAEADAKDQDWLEAHFEMWWRKVHDLIRRHGLRREWIPEMLRAAGVQCRHGVRELFEALKDNEVPTLVVSAGITNFIEHTLSQEGIACCSPSSGSSDAWRARILANDFYFDEASGALSSFTEPTMHQHAKASTGRREAEYFRGIRRRHVLILGDSPHDCDPLVNIEGIDDTIRVGFFNKDRHDTSRAVYEDVYDVLFSNEELEGGQDLDMFAIVSLLRSLGAERTPDVLGPPLEQQGRPQFSPM
mmetsp:Transcript_12562/g.36134  ORF Transcript_12562/g.36134 Transcript_12562/m.36134 type:complete len:369 (+) Transcript_12562:3-1109(+)